jgi:hypothetical protein
MKPFPLSHYDNEFLTYCVYNDPLSNNVAWHHIANLSKIILEMRGVDYTKLEFRLGNYQGTGKVAVMLDNKFVRFEE